MIQTTRSLFRSLRFQSDMNAGSRRISVLLPTLLFKTEIVVALACSVFFLGLRNAQAGMIGTSSFGPSAATTDFNDLYSTGLVNGTNAAPIVIDGHTFSTLDGNIRYGFPSSVVTGMDDERLGTDVEFGTIDIHLSSAVSKAGVWVGLSGVPLESWSAVVTFFDETNSLLGSINLGAPLGTGQFAGWEADSGLVSRIRVNDTTDNGAITYIDNLVTDNVAVPEPASVVLVGTGLVCAASLRQRRRRTMQSLL